MLGSFQLSIDSRPSILTLLLIKLIGKAVADLIYKRKLLGEEDYNIVSGKI